MSEWSFAVGPPGSVVRELKTASSRKVSFKLNEPSEASITLDGDDPAAREIVELSTDLYVFRRPSPGMPRSLVFRGRIGKTQDDINEDGHTITIPATDYRGLLKRRIFMSGFVSPSSAYANTTTGWGQRWGTGNVIPGVPAGPVDQMVIAWEMIQGVQGLPGGNLGITNGLGQTSGVKRDRTYQMGDPIADKIDELSQVIDGFDWDITATLTAGVMGLKLDRWYPGRGRVTNEVLMYTRAGGNLQSVQRQVDSGDFANAIRVKGAAGSVSTVEPAPVERIGTIGVEGRWDKQVAEDITVATALGERADWNLSQSTLIQPSYTVKLKPGFWRGPDHLWLGDTVKLVVQSGRLDVATDLRILSLDPDVDDDDNETVSMTLGYPRKDFKQKLESIDRRLSRLERR